MSAIVAIPARLNSTRFPRKVLADIHGRPMLWYVCEAVAKAQKIDGIWVLTDSDEVYDVVSSWGGKVLMTADDCPSGTARIASVIDKLDADYLVNVQGDEPLITGEIVDQVVNRLEQGDADVVTPIVRITDIAELTDTNIVKVVRASDGRALYFSRSPIPNVRDQQTDTWLSKVSFWGHVGLYGFRRQVLEEYSKLPEGKLETAEKLEQLRLLEAGKQIFTIEVHHRPLSVDVPADFEKVTKILEASRVTK